MTMMTPGTRPPVRQDVAQHALGMVFGVCGFIAVLAFMSGWLSWLLAAAAGLLASFGGWALATVPYRIMARGGGGR
jgi:hypothetical protein